MQVHLQNIKVRFIYEGHQVNFKVKGPKRSYERKYMHRYSRVILLRLKGNFVSYVI